MKKDELFLESVAQQPSQVVSSQQLEMKWIL